MFDVLKEDIVFGRLHPRERLVEADLVRRFGTNRAAVREVLGLLTDLGLVEHVPNKGASVIDPSLDDVTQIYRMRIELEGLAATWIPLPLPDADVNELITIQEVHSKAVEDRDLPLIFSQNALFHKTLNRHCGNRHLERLIHQMAQRALPIRFSTHMEQRYLDDARDDHLVIIDALRDGDRDTLVKRIRLHNQRGMDWYKAHLSLSDVPRSEISIGEIRDGQR